MTGVIDNIPFCSVAEPLLVLAQQQLARWPVKRIPWAITRPWPGVSPEDQRAVCGAAFALWSEVCDLEFPSAISEAEALIRIGARYIDGPQGVLAESELPNGTTRPVRQWYDSERWTIAEQPEPGKIDLLRVVAHELGHAIGLGHLAAGNLLAPTYSLAVRRPQTGDIAEAQRRYGPPRATPVPPPYPPIPIPVPGRNVLRVDVPACVDEVVMPGWRVTRVA